ncbi:hypothetical protein CFC21_063921 [Triticum aestivum]|uniref:Thaumatin-like protein n=2 Tax=Triticum aestivum TaxID=4565 RepID=A0A9R1GZ98_WHEAT|nr:hypothetical protein CFC21_063921 [Triticum aestivum]
MAAIPFVLVLFVVSYSYTAGAGAAVFTITNWCPDMVYPASSKDVLGLGFGLPSGDTMHTGASAGSSGKIWGRTGCTLDAHGNGTCETGDCAGQQVCNVPGKPPATVAEFTLGDTVDYYDLSLADGFNIPISFGCDDAPGALVCMDPGCSDAKHRPDDSKVHTCPANSSYHVVFCPAASML